MLGLFCANAATVAGRAGYLLFFLFSAAPNGTLVLGARGLAFLRWVAALLFMLSWVEIWTFSRHNELRGSERSHESMYGAMNMGRQ